MSVSSWINADGAIECRYAMVPIEGIVVDIRNNNRYGTYEEKDLLDLMEDISNGVGIVSPVICRPLPDLRPLLVEGYRRYAAVKLWNSQNPPSKMALLPVLMRTMNDEQAAERNVAENVHRRSLTPMDAAIGIQRFELKGYTDKQIARIYGVAGKPMSLAWVAQTRKLLSLDRKMQKMVHDGIIPVTSAIELAEMETKDRNVVVETIIRNHNSHFTKSNVRKIGRETGAFGDGTTQRSVPQPEDAAGLLGSSHSKGHTPKRKQRTIRELNEYWEGWYESAQLSQSGRDHIKTHMGFISGKISGPDMDMALLSMFGNSGRVTA